jgi:hypothetical protein
MNKYTVYLREIKVVPVIVEAESVEQAEELARQGEGDFQNEKSFHSDLCAENYFDSMLEMGTSIVK